MTRTSNSVTVQLDQIHYFSVKAGQYFQKLHSSTSEEISELGSSNPSEM